MPLTPKIRQQLKAQAHALKPIVVVGNKGLSETVNKEIDRALYDHELIKIRIQYERDERRAIFEEICQTHQAEPVQLLGSIATIYRVSEKNNAEKN